METASLVSSHGSIDFETTTGMVTRVDLEPEFGEANEFPNRVDIIEWKLTYPGETIAGARAISDFGYWDRDGVYSPPCKDWRRDMIQLKSQEALVPTIPKRELVCQASRNFLIERLPEDHVTMSIPALWEIIEDTASEEYEYTDAATMWELIMAEAQSWGEFLKEKGVLVI